MEETKMTEPYPFEEKSENPDDGDDTIDRPGMMPTFTEESAFISRSNFPEIEDISTMKRVVLSGVPEALASLMERISHAQAVEELTTTYGGGAWREVPDGDGLFKGTSPILHAARSGNLEMFSAVVEAMRANLFPQQVQKMMVDKDSCGRSLFAMAARSGNRDMIEYVLKILHQELAEYENQVREMLASRDNTGASSLALATTSGNRSAFATVLEVVTKYLTNDEVVAMLRAKGDSGRSLVAEAAKSGDYDLFETVLATIKDKNPEKVKRILLSRGYHGRSLLSWAIKSTNLDVFKAVIAAVSEMLAEKELSDILGAKDMSGRSLLAASSENKDMFEAVFAAFKATLKRYQFKNVILSRDVEGRSLLASVVWKGSAEMFRVAMTAISAELTKDEMKTIFSSLDVDGHSLLASAVWRGDVNKFRLVMDVFTDELTVEEMETLLMAEVGERSSILMEAARSGNKDLFAAVLASVKDGVSKNKFKIALSSRDVHGHSVFSRAVFSKSADVFGMALAAIKENIPVEEMGTMLVAKVHEKRSLLAEAAGSGNKDLFENVLGAVRAVLSEEQLRDILGAKDMFGRTLLVEAAGSKDKDLLEAAIASVRTSLSNKQLKSILVFRDTEGRSLLASVVWRGSEEMFRTVMVAISDVLTGHEVKLLVSSPDKNGHSLLASAVWRGSADMFKVVMAAVADHLTEEKVGEMFMAMIDGGRSLLAEAASSGNKDLFEAVLGAVRARFSKEERQVKVIFSFRDVDDHSMLSRTIWKKRADMFSLAMTAISEELTEEERGEMLTANAGERGSLLAEAARSGSKDLFKAVLAAVRAALSKEKVKNVLLARDVHGHSLLSRAVCTRSAEVFGAAMDAISEDLTKEEVGGMLMAKFDGERSLLAEAASSGKMNLFTDVLASFRTMLSKEQIKMMVSSRNVNGHSILSRAVWKRSVEMFRVAMAAASDELTKEEVGNMMMAKVDGKHSMLTEAASIENTALFEALLAAIRVNLPEEKGSIRIFRPSLMPTKLLGQSMDEGIKWSLPRLLQARAGSGKVKILVSSQDEDGSSLLSSAAKSKSVEMFVVVMAAVSKELTEKEVRKMLGVQGVVWPRWLNEAAWSGNEELLQDFFAAVRAELPPKQAKMIILSRDAHGRSFLDLAVESKSKDMFMSAMTTISEDLTEKEIADMLANIAKNGYSLLAKATSSGNKDLSEAVLAAVKGRLPKEKVKQIVLSRRDKDGRSLLSLAIHNDSAEMFVAAMTIVSEELSDVEVRDMMSVSGNLWARWLRQAAWSGNKDLFEAVLAERTRLSKDQIRGTILSRDIHGRSLLDLAVESKSKETFRAVMTALCQELTGKEIGEMVTTTAMKGRSLLAKVTISGDKELFEAVLAAIRTELPNVQVKQMLTSLNDKNMSLLTMAVARKDAEVFRMAMDAISKEFLPEEVRNLLRKKDKDPLSTKSDLLTPLDLAVRYGDAGFCDVVLENVQEHLVDKKIDEALDATFLQWADRDKEARLDENTREVSECKKVFSVLFKHLARPPKQFLRGLAQDVTKSEDHTWHSEEHGWQRFTDLVLGEVESAKNPLVPGMNLSVSLAEAAYEASEGEQRRISSLQTRVETYVLEVLERLPQTVRGFQKGMRQCSAIFEPEGPRNELCGRPGPLRVAFERPQQMENMCAVPLVMDYLSRKFTNGLPTMQDSSHILQDEDELRRLAVREDGYDLLLDGVPGRKFFRVWLQGASADIPGLTILPGAQFIVAGLLAKPNSYYRVPALRMALDFVVYIVMLAAFSTSVLLFDNGPLTIGEILFFFYVLLYDRSNRKKCYDTYLLRSFDALLGLLAVFCKAGIFTEVEEIIRNLAVYLQDSWNCLDILALLLFVAGFIARLVDNDDPMGRALYALGAPLIFSRALFFAQILPFQGPMVQVIFSMIVVLLQFGVVILAIILGFAMSIFPLFKDNCRESEQGQPDACTFDDFGDVLFLLFKAMLGEVETFNDFDNIDKSIHKLVGKVLLAVYLVVITIILLNLLVAILSTAHAKVEANVDKEFKVSRARIIDHYQLVVALDTVPPPFNLVQFVVTLPFILKGPSARKSASYRRVKQTVGQVSFWLALSPVVVIAGIVLWVGSSVYRFFPSVIAWVCLSLRDAKVRTFRLNLRVFLWCALGAPLCLFVLWIRTSFLCFPLWHVKREDNVDYSVHGIQEDDNDNVQLLLQATGVGARDLRNYLEDPMTDPNVRPDEIQRATTVEHMKLLRNRLEDRMTSCIKEVVTERIDRLEERANDLRADMNRSMELVLEHLQQIQGSIPFEGNRPDRDKHVFPGAAVKSRVESWEKR